uniref:Uncharacterized protein n=1 Tax=Anguilla anguilla TaxID=7936 RepID=A0A0E9R6V8_ANGAN
MLPGHFSKWVIQQVGGACCHSLYLLTVEKMASLAKKVPCGMI